MILAEGISCDHTLTLEALKELCRLYPDREFQIRSDGGTEFDNDDVNDFFVKKGISWKKVSKPWDNPFAERGIRTIKHEYLSQVWIGNLGEFEELSGIIKLHYNECRPHQSFDNKTPAEVRIAASSNKGKYSPTKELEKLDAFYRSILGRTKPATC